MHNTILPPNPIEELERNKALAERQLLSKKERRLLKHQQKEKEQFKHYRRKKLKKLLWLIVGILILGGAIFGGSRFLTTKLTASESAIIAKQGIHWHADLSIKILGEFQDIPAGIGLEKLPHKSIHTHDRDGVIHMEFSGLVKESDLRLGRFFEIWGREFNQDCILNKCSGIGGKVKMMVNGEESLQFENYVMQDSDKIGIIFE
ncbi:MAG: hypothetical protein Q8P63_01360 [Candidatus Nealsonbacteria bacterium]|nr:hypothetical protein [Candidatus Nealsonbacteria bacterium]